MAFFLLNMVVLCHPDHNGGQLPHRDRNKFSRKRFCLSVDSADDQRFTFGLIQPTDYVRRDWARGHGTVPTSAKDKVVKIGHCGLYGAEGKEFNERSQFLHFVSPSLDPHKTAGTFILDLTHKGAAAGTSEWIDHFEVLAGICIVLLVFLHTFNATCPCVY